MKRAAVFLALVLILLAEPSKGSPVNGKHAEYVKIGGFGEATFSEKFRGGERACVIVIGDHDPVVDLGVYVYDDKDNLVTKDEAGGDFVAAIWYPPRDAVYKINIRNPGKAWNKCYISVK